MSLITFANLVMAKTDDEKEIAQKAHYESLRNQPSDLDNINAFLSNCTTINKETVKPLNSHFIDIGKGE